jgi:phenylacetate-coenzyme A ligase PaaK-like adenylate-forming protein
MRRIRKTIAHFLRVPALLRGLHEGAENWCMGGWGSKVLDEYQLTMLNEVWTDAITNVPFYDFWKKKHNLPNNIESLEEYALWPILKKADIQSHHDLLRRDTPKRFHESVTGGATGEPLHFCTFPEQSQRVNSCILMARAGLDFYPGDRVFILWGHRHFYGHGIKSRIKFFIRQCKDWLNNSYRADACDLSPHYLRNVSRKLKRFAPDVIIAYSASLLAFVRFSKENGLQIPRHPLKCIICTAGALSYSEREEISAYFHASVYMEYGSMDAGCLAYMQKDGRYHVFSHYRMLHTINDGTGDLNLVTSLTKDYLPLFRYQIGDYLSDCKYTSDGRVETFGEIWGRGSDVITLPSGNKCQCQTFMVCAEEIKKVLAYQVIKKGETFEFCVLVASPLTTEERAIMLDKVYSILPELRHVDIKIVEKKELIKAPSGKIRLFVDMDHH